MSLKNLSYLRSRERWVLYSSNKVPFMPCGDPASSSDPRTWSTFEECSDTFNQNSDVYKGLGFVFAKEDGLVGIDLDNAFDPENNYELKPWANQIFTLFSTRGAYVELSPSMHGLHIIFRGYSTSHTIKFEGGGIEIYSEKRYFTMTGHPYKIRHKDFDAQHPDDFKLALAWLHCKYFTEEIPFDVEPPRRPLYVVSSNYSKEDQDADLRAALTHIPPESYETWIKVGMALKAGGYSVDLWDAWSFSGNAYKPGLCDRKWKTFHGNGRTLRTIFQLAKDHGYVKVRRKHG